MSEVCEVTVKSTVQKYGSGVKIWCGLILNQSVKEVEISVEFLISLTVLFLQQNIYADLKCPIGR